MALDPSYHTQDEEGQQEFLVFGHVYCRTYCGAVQGASTSLASHVTLRPMGWHR